MKLNPESHTKRETHILVNNSKNVRYLCASEPCAPGATSSMPITAKLREEQINARIVRTWTSVRRVLMTILMKVCICRRKHPIAERYWYGHKKIYDHLSLSSGMRRSQLRRFELNLGTIKTNNYQVVSILPSRAPMHLDLPSART